MHAMYVQAAFGGRRMRCTPLGSALPGGNPADSCLDWSTAAKLAAVASALAASVTFFPSGALAVSGGGGKHLHLTGYEENIFQSWVLIHSFCIMDTVDSEKAQSETHQCSLVLI